MVYRTYFRLFFFDFHRFCDSRDSRRSWGLLHFPIGGHELFSARSDLFAAPRNDGSTLSERVVPNRGYFVKPITLEWLKQIYEFRAAVEGACAELAARKANDPKLPEQLTCLAQAEYETNDRLSHEMFIREDTALHIGIAR